MVRFLLLIFIFQSGCKGSADSIKRRDCVSVYKSATSKLNDYYTNNDRAKLDTSLAEVDEIYGSCPKLKVRLSNLKITLFLLLKKYERGYAFVDSLESGNFTKPYKKDMYVKTFKALLMETHGDTIQGKRCFKEIDKEIESYITEKPFDKDAVSDLFYTKIRFESKTEVAKEIEILQSKHIEEKDFLESLKETIESLPSNNY